MPASTSTNTASGQRQRAMSSRDTSSPARLTSSSRRSSGCRGRRTRAPARRSSYAAGSSSKSPKRKTPGPPALMREKPDTAGGATNQVFVQALSMASPWGDARQSCLTHQPGGPMRPFIAPIIAVAALLAAGCSQSGSPTAPSLSPGAGGTLFSGASDAHAPHEVPFKGSLDGTVVVTPLNPPFFNVVITASGEATHLGRFSLVVPHLVNFATAMGEGNFTFTAANGDTVTAHFTGIADTSTPV